MPFFGLFRVTSWVSCLLASSQGLFRAPDYLNSFNSIGVVSVASSAIELPTSRIFTTTLSPEIWSTKLTMTAVPSLGFFGSLGSSQSQSQSTQATVRLPHSDGLEKKFCRPQFNRAETFQPVARNILSASAAWSEASNREQTEATLPQQILQVMQNLIPWRQRTESPEKALIASIVVVNAQTLERVGDKENEERQGRKGFWQFSLRSKNSAVTPDSANEQGQFQVWVKGQLIAQLPTQQQANLIAQRLKRILSESSLATLSVEPVLFDGSPAIKIGDRILFKISQHLALQLDRNEELLAAEWVNNLRVAFGQAPLRLAEAQQRLYNLQETSITFEGQASWYGSYFHGRVTATGETYNQHELTAAHPSLPFNTYLKVRNLENNESVVVRINDRGPYVPDRAIDLSREAARCIKGEKAGVMPIEAIVMEQSSNLSEQQLVYNFLFTKQADRH